MKHLFAIAIALFFGVGLAQAQDKAFDWSSCKVELEKYCKAVKGKDNEKIYLCLEEHDKDLSAQCEASHAKYEELTGKKKAK